MSDDLTVGRIVDLTPEQRLIQWGYHGPMQPFVPHHNTLEDGSVEFMVSNADFYADPPADGVVVYREHAGGRVVGVLILRPATVKD